MLWIAFITMSWINGSTTVTFPSFAHFQFGHPSRSPRPIAAPRCIVVLLACLSLSATPVGRISTTILVGKSVLPEACSSVTVSVLGYSAGAGSPATSRCFTSSLRVFVASANFVGFLTAWQSHPLTRPNLKIIWRLKKHNFSPFSETIFRKSCFCAETRLHVLSCAMLGQSCAFCAFFVVIEVV